MPDDQKLAHTQKMFRMMICPCISFPFVKMMFLIMITPGIASLAKVVRSGESGIAVNVTNVNISLI